MIWSSQESKYSKAASIFHTFSVQMLFIKNIEESQMIVNTQVLHGSVYSFRNFSVSIIVVVRDDKAFIKY